MELIEIREDAGRPDGALLRIDAYDYRVTVTSPLDKEKLEELDWYFEQHLQFPFMDQVSSSPGTIEGVQSVSRMTLLQTLDPGAPQANSSAPAGVNFT